MNCVSNIRKKLSDFTRISKDDFYVCALAAFISCFFAISIRGFISSLNENTLIVNLINNVREEWYMNTFYSDINSSNNAKERIPDIVIVDIKKTFDSRGEIADVINKVASQKPRLICVDHIFRDSESNDSTQNNKLLQTITKIKDSVNIFFVGYKGESRKVIQSFFVDSLRLKYGLSDFSDFRKYNAFVDDTIPRISAVLAKELGVDINNLPNPMVINYRNKEFYKIPIKDSIDLDYLRHSISNKVVLIGEYDAIDDTHTTPFIINGRRMISGIEEIAFEVSSLTNIAEKKAIRTRHPYSYMSMWQNILLYLAFIVFYCFALNRIYIINKKFALASLFLKPMLLLFIEFLLVYFCFLYTANYYTIPNIALLATSLVFVDLSYELSLYCYHRIQKCITNKNTNNYEK